MNRPITNAPQLPPQTPHKAIVAAVLSLVLVLVDQVQAHGWDWRAIVVSLLASLVTGGGTYAVRNHPKGP